MCRPVRAGSGRATPSRRAVQFPQMAARDESVPITRLLLAWGNGDREAQDQLWPELYPELRVLARSVLRRRARAGGPGTTSLVHEAALKLLDTEIDWNDRRHFYAVAARAMRFTLVDEARRKLSQKRGPEAVAVELSVEPQDPNAHLPEEVLAVHQALERLAKLNPRQERLVELRYFAGMTTDETARVLGVSTPTVVRDWRAVKTWLVLQLQPAN